MSNSVYKAALKMISDRVQHQPSTKAESYFCPSVAVDLHEDLHNLFYDGFNAGQVAANNDCAKIAQEALDAVCATEYDGNVVSISNLVQVIDPHTGEYLYFPK
jgi:hypothetical protein